MYENDPATMILRVKAAKRREQLALDRAAMAKNRDFDNQQRKSSPRSPASPSPVRSPGVGADSDSDLDLGGGGDGLDSLNLLDDC